MRESFSIRALTSQPSTHPSRLQTIPTLIQVPIQLTGVGVPGPCRAQRRPPLTVYALRLCWMFIGGGCSCWRESSCCQPAAGHYRHSDNNKERLLASVHVCSDADTHTHTQSRCLGHILAGWFLQTPKKTSDKLEPFSSDDISRCCSYQRTIIIEECKENFIFGLFPPVCGPFSRFGWSLGLASPMGRLEIFNL